MQEYWPASGRYERKTVIHMSNTMGSCQTFRKDCKRNKAAKLIQFDHTVDGGVAC